MKVTNKALTMQIMERIEILHQHVQNIESAQRFLKERFRKHPEGLRAALIEQELDEWRSMLMWAITLTPDEQERIKVAVYDRFIGEKAGVSHWLSETGETPGMWLEADDKAFRDMAQRAFAPQEQP